MSNNIASSSVNIRATLASVGITEYDDYISVSTTAGNTVDPDSGLEIVLERNTGIVFTVVVMPEYLTLYK